MYIALYSVRNKVKDWSLFSRQVALTNKSPLASLTILRYNKSPRGGGKPDYLWVGQRLGEGVFDELHHIR